MVSTTANDPPRKTSHARELAEMRTCEGNQNSVRRHTKIAPTMITASKMFAISLVKPWTPNVSLQQSASYSSPAASSYASRSNGVITRNSAGVRIFVTCETRLSPRATLIKYGALTSRSR